jgi:putative ABC transport system permease protein
VQASGPDKIVQVQNEVADLLRQRHKLNDEEDDDFTIRNQQEITDAATATSRVLTVLVVSIASVSLLVGGIGIMNIMLVSVTERTREIGIRMAVGAHGRDILLQFLIEATSLSSLGGIIGIVLGIGASKLLSICANWPTVVSPISVVLSFMFSACVGIFFGFYPARKAAALDPIDALRYE